MWKNIKGVNVKNNTPEAQQKENEGNEDKFEVSASLVLRSPDVLLGKNHSNLEQGDHQVRY